MFAPMKLEAAYRKVVKEGVGFAKMSTLWNARTQVNRGELPSVELMRDRVKKAGYKCVQEEMWSK